MNPRFIQIVMSLKSGTVGAICRLILIPSTVTIRRGIPYANNPLCKLDIYSDKPGGTYSLKQAVIVVHGGGGIAGDKRERALFCAALAKEGYVVFNINYRLAPQSQFPSAINDCIQAVQWVNSHAGTYGADPEHISVIGDSAGAYIASLAAVTGDTQKHIKKLILYYGIYNLKTIQKVRRPLMQTYLKAMTGQNSTLLSSTVSPISYAQKFPSTLLIASEKDPLHTQTIELSQALKQPKQKHQVLLLDKQNYPHANHGFQSLPRSKAAKMSFSAVTSFLQSLNT